MSCFRLLFFNFQFLVFFFGEGRRKLILIPIHSLSYKLFFIFCWWKIIIHCNEACKLIHLIKYLFFFFGVFLFFLFGYMCNSASGCPIANRNKLRALEMESVVEKQRHMTSIGNGASNSSLLVSTNPNNNLNNNSIISTVSGSNSITTSNSHSYMSSLPLTSLVPPSSVALSSQTSSTSSSAIKIDGINCPTVGLYSKKKNYNNLFSSAQFKKDNKINTICLLRFVLLLLQFISIRIAKQVVMEAVI